MQMGYLCLECRAIDPLVETPLSLVVLGLLKPDLLLGQVLHSSHRAKGRQEGEESHEGSEALSLATGRQTGWGRQAAH